MTGTTLRRLGLTSASAAALIALGAPVAVQAQAARYSFDIPAQDLGTALRAYARTTRQQLSFDSADTQGRKSPGVIGSLDADTALRTLLAGTGFGFSRTERGVILVRPMAQAVMAPGSEPQLVDELVVTGTRLEGASAPTRVYSSDAEDVRRSGEPTLFQYLNRLPQVSIGATGLPSQRAAGEAVVQLRGLPEGTTQVLLNGRALGVGGVNVKAAFDLNVLPPAIVERLDVLPSGSSAIYGSDAVGGVVNIVTRGPFNGLEASVGYDFADSYESKRAVVAAGRVFERGGVVGMLSFQTNDGVRGVDRKFSQDSNFSRYADKGGVDYRTTGCRPGTVTAVSGVLNGVGTSIAGIPATGIDDPSNYLAGVTNRCNYLSGQLLTAPADRFGAYAAGEFEVVEGLQIYGDLLYSGAQVDATSNGRTLSSQLVPASNAFNPFGQDVRITTRLPVAYGYAAETELIRPLVGLRYEFRGLKLDGAAWTTIIDQQTTDKAYAIDSSITPLLASSDPATALNLFDVMSNPKAMLEGLSVSSVMKARTEASAVNLTLTGDLLDLPAGSLKAAFGGELRYDEYRNEDPTRTIRVAAADRSISSVFGEVGIPLLRGDGGRPLLQASLAARRDDYSDVGSNTSPQAALTWRPTDGLTIRASYSEAFKAPGLSQLHLARSTYAGTPGYFYDAKRGETINYAFITYGGGNPDLKSETAQARSVSLEWRPAGSGLRLGVTYWRIAMDDRIALNLGVQGVLTNEDVFTGRVVREPSTGGAPGRVVSIDYSALNYGSLRLDGLDADASYRFDTTLGAVTVGGAVTRTLSYKAQLRPDQPYVNRRSAAVDGDSWAPEWKGNLYLNWETDWGTFGAMARYTGEYLDYQPRPNTNKLGHYAYIDLSMNVPVGRKLGLPGAANSSYVAASVSNLLDLQPQYSNFSVYGFDPTQADLVGRRMSITLGARF